VPINTVPGYTPRVTGHGRPGFPRLSRIVGDAEIEGSRMKIDGARSAVNRHVEMSLLAEVLCRPLAFVIPERAKARAP
jgi:hypothetical protein